MFVSMCACSASTVMNVVDHSHAVAQQTLHVNDDRALNVLEIPEESQERTLPTWRPCP